MVRINLTECFLSPTWTSADSLKVTKEVRDFPTLYWHHPHCVENLNSIKFNSLLYLQYNTHTGKFPASFFNSHAPVAQTKTYMNAREVMEFLVLKPGEYLIVPSTFNPNETASFLLTIISKAKTQA